MKQESKIPELYSTFFTHTRNPWSKAPESIQSLFRKSIQIKPLGQQFPQGIKHSIYCGNTKQYDDTCKYSIKADYCCNDCGIDSDTAYFCYNCFEEQEHEGHDYTDFEDDGSWRPDCCCGIAWECKASACCGSHGQDKIEAEIDEELKKKFINFFQPIYQILFFLHEQKEFETLFKETEREISSSMKNWATDCLSYCRIITELFMTQVTVNEQRTIIMDEIIKRNVHREVFEVLQYVEVFRFNFMKSSLRLKSKGVDVSHYYDFYRRFMSVPKTLESLLDGGEFFIQKIRGYLNHASEISSKKETQQYLEKVFTSCLKGIDNQSLVDHFRSNIKVNIFNKLNKKTMLLIIKRLFQIFTDQEKSKNQLFNNVRWYFKEIMVLIVSGLGFWLQNKFSSLVQVVSFIKELDIQERNIQIFLGALLQILNYENFKTDENQDKSMTIFIFFTINSLSSKEDIVDLLWKLLHGEQNRMYDIIQRFYRFFSLIIRSEIHCRLIRLENQKIQKNQIEKEKQAQVEENQEISQKLEKDFLLFLKEKKTINKRDIWRKKRNGQLNFENATHILTNLCSFNQQLDCFILKEEEGNQQNDEQEIIISDLFPLEQSYHERMKYLQKETTIEKISGFQPLVQNQHISKFLNIIFSSPSFLKYFKGKYSKVIEQDPSFQWEVNNWRNQKNAYHCIFFLVLADKACHGKNVEVSQELNKLKTDQVYLQKFQNLGHTNLIRKLLHLQEKVSQQIQHHISEEIKESENIDQQPQKNIPEKKEEISEMKLKGAGKRNKLYAKFREKNKNLISKLASKSMSISIQQNEDVCVLCHQRNKPNKRLIYLGGVSKGQSLSCSFYGEENKARVLMTTCLHTLHIQCFEGIQKHNNQFNCPLCKKNSNCFLPVQFSLEDEDYNESCLNSIIISLGVHSNCYHHEGLFMLIFKHLMESFGLNNLVSVIKYDSQKFFTRKTNQYFTKLILEFYSNSSEKERLKYKDKVHELIYETSKCKDSLLGDVQSFICTAVWNKIIGQNSTDAELLKKIHTGLNEDEFKILKTEIQQFIETPIAEFPTQNTDKRSIGFKLIDLPETADKFVKIRKESCTFCSERNNQYMCLMCGDILCNSCFQQHYKRHGSLKFYLYFYYMRGEFQWETRGQHHSDRQYLYYNVYKMSFPEASSEDQQSETFFFSQYHLNSLLQKFLQH